MFRYNWLPGFQNNAMLFRARWGNTIVPDDWTYG